MAALELVSGRIAGTNFSKDISMTMPTVFGIRKTLATLPMVLFVLGSRYPAHAENIKTSHQALSVASATVWPGPISVCWEFDGRDREKIAVRQAIASTWEAKSSVRFTGWQACSLGAANVRIAVEDNAKNNPHTIGLGKALNGKPRGMVLNFDFAKWNTVCSSDDATRMSCIRSVAVHEFGHAMGFAHEQNRPDAACEVQPQGGNGDVFVGVADLDSVMNYCNPKWNNGGALSDTDIVGARQFYGTPPGVLSPAPGGSYTLTCNPRETDGSTLFATCRGKNDVFYKTAMSQYKMCKGEIVNLDGLLACTSRPLPPGTYLASCRDMVVDQNVLSGSCRSRDGVYRRTQLGEYSACAGIISNEDGQLSCAKGGAPPAGTYQSTCQNLNVKSGTLYAACRPMSGGGLVNTWLHNYGACLGNISNDDGDLRCNNRLPVPHGTFSNSCNTVFNNSGDLSAHCKKRDGNWERSTLSNFASCRTNIENSDGKLICSR